MRLVIDISNDDFNFIKDLKFVMGGRGRCKTIQCNVINAIKNGTPLANVTDEQISEAFQIAIANYWEEKSKCLTPPPTPCSAECQTESLISRYQNDFINKQEAEDRSQHNYHM